MEVLQRTANRGSISTGGYEIDNSLKIEADNAERLQRVYSGQSGSISSRTPTSTKIATFSFWIKRTELQPSGNHLIFLADANFTWIGFNNDNLYILGSTSGIGLRSTAFFRDTSAWYHIVVAFDTTQSTASNRVKAYVNGEQVTAWGVQENFGTQNNDIDLYDTNTSHYLGWSDAQSQSGYYAEFYLIDGQQLAPTEFGETDDDSGIWKPKAYGGTFGNQGYHLDFEDSSDLGKDVSGNGNNFTSHYNGSAADQATDTPTNNFCTWNPLVTNAGVFTYTEGATKWKPSSGNWQTTTASMGFTKGKWYAEFKMDSNVTAAMVGLQELEKTTNYVGNYLGYSTNSTSMGLGYYNADGKIYKSAGSSSYGASYPSSVLVGVAIEYKDNGVLNLYVAKDNVWQNSADPANGTGGFAANSGSAVDGFFSFAASLYQNPGYWQANFGGYTVNSISSAASDANGYGTFEYAPPSGYYALCTKNLAEYG